MTAQERYIALIAKAAKGIILTGVICLFAFYSNAQNTKGDKPVKNQRQVRETRQKSYKRKEKGRTRDIAGRRLRTLDQSSANRANAKYPQPQPYSRRIKKQPEQAARPRGRVFSRSPRESRTRAWRGDVSGHSIRRVIPGGRDAAPANVYPQSGPFVKAYKKKPSEPKRPTVTRNVQGRPVGVKHPQRYEERAWKGAADKGPIRNQSATGSVRNTFSQKGPYVRYYRKNRNTNDAPVSNNAQVRRVKSLSRKPLTGTGIVSSQPGTRSRPFVQRGRKNVYWGKLQRKEQGTTTDLTGGPLRTRNYKSPVAGLISRDTVKFFGRKPIGDRANRAGGGGYATRSRKGQRGWKGDIAGFNLRKSRSRGKETPGEYFYRRQLSISGSGEKKGTPIPGKFLPQLLGGGKGRRQPQGGGGSRSAQWNNKGKSIQGRPPGQGYVRGATFSGTFKQGQPGFSKEGTGYSGNIRRSSIRGFGTDGVNYSGKIKRSSQRGFGTDGVNYSGRIKRSSIRGFGTDGVNYSGRIRRSEVRGFSKQGANYQGNIRRYGAVKQFNENGVGYSGRLKRSDTKSIGVDGVNYSGRIKRGSIRGIELNGIDYSGRQKGKRPVKGGGSLSGVLWNNDNRAIQPRPPVSEQGGNFSGNIKYKRPQKGGGSVSGKLWNNENRAIEGRGIRSEQGGNFAGNIKYKRPEKGGGSISGKLWNNENRAIEVRGPRSEQGGNFAGNIKYKRPEKGGGSVSGKLWNNENRAIEVRGPRSEQGGNFAGNIKYKRPEKGGGSVSGKLWNNDNRAIEVRAPRSEQGGNFAGNIKYKRPEKGGGSVSGKLWNNDNKPLSTKPELNANVNYSGRQALSRFKKNYVQNPNASKESMRKRRPDATTYSVAGLHVKVKEHPNGRNPNSADDALRGRSPGKAAAQIRDFQGNVKMKKYSGSRLHPDSQFAHGFRDNVKEERTLLMNVKLMWGKLFRKNETQPENLKVRNPRPGYDKREKNLWAK